MSENAKFVQLLENIRDATAKGRLQWEDTIHEDSFRLVLDYAILRIGVSYDDGLERETYSAFLMNEAGRVVDSLTSEEGSRELLANLFGLARRSARGAEDLIDRMLGDLTLSA